MVQPKFRTRVLGATLVGIALCSPALASVGVPLGPAADRIETELHRTDALIDRARDEVADAQGSFAHERLKRATEIQRDAWVEFGGVAPDLRRVVLLTQEARKLALKAIEAAGIERRAQEAVRGRIDLAEARAEQVAAKVRDAGGDLAQRLLDSALQQLRRAREAWAANDPRAARLAALSLSLLDRAERATAGSGTAIAAAQASIDRTEALLAELDARIAQAPAAPDLASERKQIGELLDRARDALRRGAERPAVHASLEARELALRLLGRLQPPPTAADLLPALDDLAALRDELAPEIETSGNADARAQLAACGAQLERARGLVAAGAIPDAVAALAAAETLLRQAADAAGVR